MKFLPVIWLCFAVFGTPLIAQVTTTIQVLQTARATATSGGSQSAPPGLLPGNLMQLSANGPLSHASFYAQPLPGLPAGAGGVLIDASTDASMLPFGSNQTASVVGELLFDFRAPAATAAILYVSLHASATSPLATTRIQLDLDNNGSIDFDSVTINRDFDVPIVVGPTPLLVRAIVQGSSSVSGFGAYSYSVSSSGGATLAVLPNTYGLDRYGQGCLPIQTSRHPLQQFAPMVVCQRPYSTTVGVMLVFGLTPLTATVPWPPNCALLVQPSTLVLAPVWMYGTYYVLPPVSLPPGLQFFGQVVLLDSLGEAWSSDAFRTL